MINGKNPIGTLAIALVSALLLLARPASAMEPKWSKEPYSHTAQDESLRDMLADFTNSSGVRAVISRQINDRVSGRFEGQAPAKFMEKIARIYGLFWFYDGSHLYIYKSSEIRSRSWSLQFVTLAKLAAALKDQGIWDDRYPLRSGISDEAVSVTGPPRYIEMILEVSARLDGKGLESAPTFADGQTIKVFPLRYAWAGDVTFTLSGKQNTVPGVASLLNNLINKDPTVVRPNTMEADYATALRGVSSKPEGSDFPQTMLINAQQQPGAAAALKSRIGIYADTRTNSVLIKDTRENLQRFLPIVNAMDVPMGLVELNATIIDVSNGSVLDLGVEWQNASINTINGKKFNVLQGQTFSQLNPPDKDGNPPPTPVTPPLLDGYTFSTLGSALGNVFMARLRALEGKGLARVASRPSVLTFDNLEASIGHTQTLHVRVAGERDANLFQIQTGTVLKVTPHITEDEGGKNLRLVVSIEDGAPATDTPVDNIPIINTSVINTQAIIGEGESLLLGGFIRTEETVTSSQVPLLGSIPVIGNLFKKSTRIKNKVERIFMITPRIIETAGEAGKIFEQDDKERRYQKTMIPDEDESPVTPEERGGTRSGGLSQ
jgi:type III secretion protein C